MTMWRQTLDLISNRQKLTGADVEFGSSFTKTLFVFTTLSHKYPEAWQTSGGMDLSTHKNK